MADRWSNPSANYGYQRFRVWPLGTDKYDHTEFVSNWDKVDAIFGTPESGSWGEDNGLYGEIKKAQDGAIPLGMLYPWFRPSLTVPFPTGYVVADGTTLTAAEHDFPGGGNVVLPDLRNRFVLGADMEKDIGEAGASVESPLVYVADGAPGPQGTGGSNIVELVTKNLPPHSHTGGFTGWSPAIMTWYFQSSTYEEQKHAVGFTTSNGYFGPERTAPIYPENDNFESIRWSKGINYSSGNGGYQISQHRHTLSILESGNDDIHENRPRYIGLIWLIKVKNG